MSKLRKEGLIIIASILIVAQYVLSFFVFGLVNNYFLQILGWIIWLISLYFGFAPIIILRKSGDVETGKSYVHTNRLVKTNLYSIVRHPQYVAGILFSISLILLSFHWLVILIGLVTSLLIYLDIQVADHQGIEKFGEEYREYMKTVPQVNFVSGFIKKLGGKNK